MRPAWISPSAASSRSNANSRWMARRIGRCSTMPALRHQESRHGLPDDLACRDATRCCVSTQTAREAFRHFERDRNRVLGRQWWRTRSRQFEVAIGLSSRKAKGARQSHGGPRHADLVREQAPRRSQSFGLLHSRRTNHLTRAYYLLRLKSTTHCPRQPTIARSKRKLSFAFREPSHRFWPTSTCTTSSTSGLSAGDGVRLRAT